MYLKHSDYYTGGRFYIKHIESPHLADRSVVIPRSVMANSIIDLGIDWAVASLDYWDGASEPTPRLSLKPLWRCGHF